MNESNKISKPAPFFDQNLNKQKKRNVTSNKQKSFLSQHKGRTHHINAVLIVVDLTPEARIMNVEDMWVHE